MTDKKRNALIFLVCYLAYSAVYIARFNLSMAAPVLESMHLVNKAQIGILGSLFFITYALGQLFNGNLGDLVKPKTMIILGLATAGLCNALIGILPPFAVILLLWGLNGYAQSMVWGPMLRSITQMYDSKKSAAVASFLVSSVAAGSVAGILLAKASIARFGVDFAFYIPGFLTLVISAFVAIFLKTKNEKPVHKERIPLRRIFFHKEVAIMILPAMAHGVLKDNINLWAPVFFADRFHFNIKGMAYYVLLIPVISFFGRMSYPFFFKRCGGNENLLSIFAFTSCALAVIPLLFPSVPPVLTAVCFSIIAAAISIINTSLLSIFPMKFCESGNVSQVAGVMDFLTYLGAGVSSFVYGIVLQYIGYGAMFFSWIFLSVLALLLLVRKSVINEDLTIPARFLRTFAFIPGIFRK